MGGSPVSARREGFVVRVLRAASQSPAGVGFVVGERHILTCAHVVNTVLGRDLRAQEAPGPGARVQVDFPALGDAEGAPSRTCRVAVWVTPPVAGATGGDVAGLVLVGEGLPEGAGPARLAEAEDLRDVEVAVFGYPGQPPRQAGAWAGCRLRGAVGAGMIQLDADSESAFRVQPGYSGSPAVVANGVGDGVVGMVAAASWDAERDAYAIPVAHLVQAWPEVLETVPVCPYRGLLPFRASDAEAGLFVGREAETDQLVRMVDQRALVVVVGPSGVGKSSLVTAGLLPALSTEQWATAIFRPGQMPCFALAKTLYELEGSQPSVEDVERRGERLRREGLTGLAAELGVLTGKRILLCIDQFEEIFAICPDEERAVFLDQVLPSADADDAALRVVCTLRADFLAQLLNHPSVGARLQDRLVPLSPMDQDALERAITVPAQLCGVTYEEGLVQHIALDAAKGDGGLPLMEFALTQLWPRQHRRKLAFTDYYALTSGGVIGILNRYAEDVFEQLEQDWPVERIRRVLLACVRSRGDAAAATRRIVDRDRLAEDWALVEKLAERRLLMTGEDPTRHTATVELAHEALIQSWERLATWVDADAQFQRWLTTIEDRVGEGELAEARISEAQQWLAERPEDIPRDVREFIERSSTLVQQRIIQLERAREAAHQRARLLRRFAAALTVLLVVASGASIVAFTEQHTAAHQRDLAVSAQVAGQALDLRATNPGLAAQLALAAYRLAPTTEARSSLLSIAAAPYSTQMTGHRGYVVAVAFSLDGYTLATASRDKTVRLWDVRDPHHPRLLGTLTSPAGAVHAVAFSPDGRTLTLTTDSATRLWDLGDTRNPRLLSVLTTGHLGNVDALASSPQGHILATASQDQTVQLWDVGDPRHPSPLGTLNSHTRTGVAFSADGRTLATAGDDRLARLWDIRDPRQPHLLGILPGHTDAVTGVAFSPDGHMLATASRDATARLWDVGDPRQPHALGTLIGHTGVLHGVAFSPDGRTLATASADHTTRLWDLSGPVLAGHTGGVHGVAFSPDGKTLATASYDHTARLWDVRDPYQPHPLATLTGLPGIVYGVAFSPDGRILATVGSRHAARLWQVDNPAQPRLLSTLIGHTRSVYRVAFSPDGRTLATASADHTARLWDIRDPRQPRLLSRLPSSAGAVHAVAFSLDGRALATAADDDTVRLWDIRDPRQPRLLRILTSHTDAVRSVAFSTDGRTLATASADDTVRLWDIRDLRQPRLLRILPVPAAVDRVAFSPDGHILAATSADHTVWLWRVDNPAQPRLLGILTGHTNYLYAVAFSPNGHTLATASADHTARLWETNVESVAARICRMTPAITKSEWDRYLTGRPYHPPCR